MGNGEIHVNKLPIKVDNSTVFINAVASRKIGYDLGVSSHNFSGKDIYSLVTSNIFIPNGKELLAPICDVFGNVNFNINIKNDKINGTIDTKNAEFKIVDLLKMPVKINEGKIVINPEKIALKEFKGFYNNNKQNHFVMNGDIKDYYKTCDTNIVSDIFINNDFFKNYLSKMLGMPISLVGDAGSRLTLTSKNGSCDLVWYFLLRENEGFMLGDQSMVLKDYQTLFKVDLSVIDNILKLNTIDYFITSELKKGITPILSINGNIDMADNMKLLDLNLKIPRPLPSEFLNFISCQQIFKKGTISGEMSINNRGSVPYMLGNLAMEKVRIPAQRLFIKTGNLVAEGKNINIISQGKFKRSEYSLNGTILNELQLPIVVKNANLTIDNVDVEKFISSVNSNNEQSANEVLATKASNDDENNDIPTFTKGLIIDDNCTFDLLKGVYKEINFGNLHADLTLDKDGVLKIQSNKFDIADGISTLRVNADLIKKKYYLRLGIKDVESDIMASSILGLPREISGKAKGLIELNTDESLKLNGDIKFNISNGTIEKIGYVEYILKVASLFRNPLAMISPTTIGDLVNIPEGTFDRIYGELHLKDNVVLPLKIQSSATELATFIVGTYNLENNDSSLRIYTKFSDKGKGFAGVLRNISLNTLARKISISGRNDSNYYASELEQIPKLEVGEDSAQVFLTKVDGDVVNFNFLSSLKRIK